MISGVTLMDPLTTYIDADVTIGADTVIYPGSILEGKTRVGAGCDLARGLTSSIPPLATPLWSTPQ